MPHARMGISSRSGAGFRSREGVKSWSTERSCPYERMATVENWTKTNHIALLGLDVGCNTCTFKLLTRVKPVPGIGLVVFRTKMIVRGLWSLVAEGELC